MFAATVGDTVEGTEPVNWHVSGSFIDYDDEGRLAGSEAPGNETRVFLPMMNR